MSQSGFEKEHCICGFGFFFVAIKKTEKKKKHKMKFAKIAQENSVCAVIKQEKFEKVFFFQNLPHTICVRKGETKTAFLCTLSVLAKMLGAKNSQKQQKNNKTSGFGGNCLKPKMTHFF